MPWFDEQNIEGYVGARSAFAAPQTNVASQVQGAAPGQAPEGGAAAPAFDPRQQVGHDGTINGMNREQYRDAWMGSGARSMADMQAFLGKNGGSLVSDNGTVRTPFCEELDMGINARGSAAGNGPMRAGWGGGGGGQAPETIQFTDTLVFRKTVTVNPRSVDRYGRLVARVLVDGRDVSLALVQAGFAWHYTRYSRDGALADAEKIARGQRLGLWRDSTARVPWAFRAPMTMEPGASAPRAP